MKVAVTGATGTIGRVAVRELRARGDQVVALSRDPSSAQQLLGADVEVHAWPDPTATPPPAAALADVDAVIHLLGEPVAQRWTKSVRYKIHASRMLGTRNLVAGIRGAGPRLKTLISQSASGYYGPHGDERVDETFPAAEDDFLGGVTIVWEAEARNAEEFDVRVARMRSGVVLAKGGGALARMLPPFKLGLGGPVAGGNQWVPWVHIDDVVGAMLFVLDHPNLNGAYNVSAPEPVTNAVFSVRLGNVLRRPARLPLPGAFLRLLFGGMASIVTTGVRMIPKRLQDAGYQFRHPDLVEALRDVTGS
jgi:uncharacterized protein